MLTAAVIRRTPLLQRAFCLFPTTRIHLSEDMEAVQGEESVGIQVYTCKEFPGFAGILKQRYSDFVVREIDINGNVAYLNELNANAVEKATFKKEEVTDSGSDNLDSAVICEKFVETMCSLVTLSEEVQLNLRSFLMACLSRDEECPKEFIAFPCTVKETRTAAHMAIKTLAPVYIIATFFCDVCDEMSKLFYTVIVCCLIKDSI